jgi:hypothetical protein
MSTVLLGYMIVKKEYKRVLLLLTILFSTNLVFFWTPFVTYNKIAYNRYVVTSTGLNLLEGLGEFENRWGYRLSDGWYTEFMKKNYPEIETDIERDDKARELFWAAVKEDPAHYITSVLKRIPRILFPGLPWFKYVRPNQIGFYRRYLSGTPLTTIIKEIFSSPIMLFDFIARYIYIGLFLLLAYLGILLLLIRKKFFPVCFILIGVISSGYSVILMHTDHRYLIPYCAFFALFVGHVIPPTKERT